MSISSKPAQPHKKKILYVITKSNFGGAQRYVYELATAMQTHGFEAAVAFGGHGTLEHMLHEASVDTHHIASFERDVNLRKEISAFFELMRIIRTVRPHIVHLNSSKAGGTGALAARLCGVPKIVFTAHGWPFFEKRSFLWRSIVWLLSYVTTLLVHEVIVVSAHDRTHARMPFVSKKCTLIHTGIGDMELMPRETARTLLFSEKESVRHAHDLFVVSTGEHTANKNLLTLLMAVEALRTLNTQRNIFLTLMSDGEERSMLTSYVAEHHLSEYVHFTGFLKDARTYLSAFDVFVLPSKKEGLPYGLLEAGAAGLATIASNVGGIPEVMTHEVHGLLIHPTDTSALTQALTTLLDDPAQRRTYGDALRTRVREQFSLTKMIDATNRLYRA